MFLIRNIKISVKVKPLVLNNVVKKFNTEGLAFKSFSNFLTFKNNHFTFVCFKKGKRKHSHINITQIPTFSLIPEALKVIKRLFECPIVSYSVDNIIATSDLKRSICLKKVIEEKKFDKIKYNNEVFPGLFIKFSSGTVILFHSGKIVVVGCKSLDSVQCIIQTVHANI